MKLDPITVLIFSNCAALVILVIGKMIDWFSGRSKTNTDALLMNTLAVTKLQVEMVHIAKALESMPKLKQDIDAAHHFIRELKNLKEERET